MTDLHERSCDVILNELGHLKGDVDDLKKEVKELRDRVEKIKEILTTLYEQFTPIKRIVYGMVGIILTTVIGGILLLLFRKG